MLPTNSECLIGISDAISEFCLRVSVIFPTCSLYPQQKRAYSALQVKCCFTSTETVGLLGTGAQDVYLDFHWVRRGGGGSGTCVMLVPSAPTRKSRQDRHHQNNGYQSAGEPAIAAEQLVYFATCHFQQLLGTSHSHKDSVHRSDCSKLLKQQTVRLTTWEPSSISLLTQTSTPTNIHHKYETAQTDTAAVCRKFRHLFISNDQFVPHSRLRCATPKQVHIFVLSLSYV